MSTSAAASALPVIVIIGSLNVDLTTYTSRIPTGGETIYANSFGSGSGGKGGNQAVACARLSRRRVDLQNGTATVKMIGAVGNDEYGRRLLKDLQASGVETSGIATRADVETGVAVILVEQTTGENRILIHAGANHSLQTSQFEPIPGPRPSLLILQLEIPVATTVKIIRSARRAGIDVLLNPAPAIELPEESYDGLKHLVLNETEAVTLSGCSLAEVEEESSLPAVAQIFHGRGVENVIITLGSRGVFFSAPNGVCGLTRARKVEVVDTTAAGDTFVGAYALEAVRPDFDIRAAVQKANQAAAKTIGRRGAAVSIPFLDELEGIE